MSRFAALLSLIAASSLFGQAVPDICSAVFTQGIRNNYDVYTEEERFNLYKERILKLKHETYESFKSNAQSVGLDIPVAEGLLGLTGSNDEKAAQFQSRYEEFRSATYTQAKYRRVFQSHSSEISDDLLDSWNNCVAQYYQTWLASKGVVASVTPLPDFNKFVVTLDVRPAMLNTVKITGLEPTGLVACRHGDNQPVTPGTTLIDSAAFSMTCTKEPTLAVPFVVNTGAGRSETINIPASSSKLAELTRFVAELRSEIADLRQAQAEAAAATARKIEEVRGEIPHTIGFGVARRRAVHADGWSHNNETSKCEPNEVVTGVTGGNNADTWVACQGIYLSK